MSTLERGRRLSLVGGLSEVTQLQTVVRFPRPEDALSRYNLPLAAWMRVCVMLLLLLLGWGCCDAWQHIEMHSTQCNAAQLVRFSSSQCRFPTIWDTVAIVTHRRVATQPLTHPPFPFSSLTCFSRRLYINFLYAYSHRGTKTTRPVAQRQQPLLTLLTADELWIYRTLWIWHAWLARHSCNLKLFAHWIRTLHSVSLYTPHTMAWKFHFNLVLYIVYWRS